MDEVKKRLLESKGYKVGSVADFLDLTPAESEYIEFKLFLSQSVKENRQKTKHRFNSDIAILAHKLFFNIALRHIIHRDILKSRVLHEYGIFP